MADAYAQITRNAALVSLHSAGGLGNALGTIYTAYRNHAPLVILAGQQTRAMLGGPDPFLYRAGCRLACPSRTSSGASNRPRAQGRSRRRSPARYYVAMRAGRSVPTFVSVPEDDWDAPSARNSSVRTHLRRFRCERSGGARRCSPPRSTRSQNAGDRCRIGRGSRRSGAISRFSLADAPVRSYI